MLSIFWWNVHVYKLIKNWYDSIDTGVSDPYDKNLFPK